MPNANLPRLSDLISAARQANIAVAGWGWCQGEDPVGEAQLASQALISFGLDDYVADIEQGVNDANWTAAEVGQFVSTIRGKLKPGAGLAISSHGFIEYQDPKIFDQVVAQVDCLNPQAYWFTDKPNAKMLAFIKASAGTYALDDPASYARLCYDRWTKRYKRPVILSGQTCPEGDLDQAAADSQMDRFLQKFVPPAGLVGVNFWHWGSISRHIRDALAAAR